MLLLPCFAAVLILGLTPAGALLSDFLSSQTGLSPSQALPVVYAAVVVGLALILWPLIRSRTPDNDQPTEDALLETGTWRAQGILVLLGAGTFLTALLALLLVPAGQLQILLVGGCVALTIAPLSYVKPSWPPPLLPDEGGSESDAPAPKGDQKEAVGQKRLHYCWNYRNSLFPPGDSMKSASLDLAIAVENYEHFKTIKREDPTQDERGYGVLATYVRNGNTPEVSVCSKQLKNIATAERLLTLDTVNLVLAFVQSALDHAPDETAQGPFGYCKYPIETLTEKKGDVKNKAILAAALLQEIGWNVVLVVLEGVDKTARVGVGLPADVELPFKSLIEDNGRRYYFCEITPEGDSYIGETPDVVQSKIKGASCFRI